MPKLKPTEQEAANRIVRSCISANMERQAMNNEQLAAVLGQTAITVRRKRNSPENFTLQDMQRMAKKLKFTPIQAASMVLGRDLTTKEIKEFILM